MKRILYIIFSAVLVLNFGACSDDFLEVESSDRLFVDDYYNSESRIFEALVAAYDPLTWFDYAWGQYNHLGMISDIMSDDVYVGGSGPDDQSYLHMMFNYNAHPTQVCSDLWTVFYSGVNRSNIVLKYMDNAVDITEENKALYTAEAKVLRAFYYNWLWKLWGNVPYYEQNLEFPYTHEQNSADEVYEKTVVNIEDAIKNGGLPMRCSSEWNGRVTLAMAYMLYAEMVMYQKDQDRYAQALQYMEELYNSPDYSLVEDYASIWEESGEWSSESIFEINYFSNGGQRAWDNALGDGGSVYPKLIGINALSGSPDFEGGWGFEPVRESAYEAYDPQDERRDANILNFEVYSAETGASRTPRYQDEGYFLRKYLPRVGGNANHSGNADMNYNNNFRVYRLAETALNAAELIARGVTGAEKSADFYLTEVRKRAGLDPIEPTVDNILKERRFELFGEGKRYWDLIRSGKAVEKLVPGEYRTNSWTENKKYLPIPQSEMDASPSTLTQNPY